MVGVCISAHGRTGEPYLYSIKYTERSCEVCGGHMVPGGQSMVPAGQ